MVAICSIMLVLGLLSLFHYSTWGRIFMFKMNDFLFSFWRHDKFFLLPGHDKLIICYLYAD